MCLVRIGLISILFLKMVMSTEEIRLDCTVMKRYPAEIQSNVL